MKKNIFWQVVSESKATATSAAITRAGIYEQNEEGYFAFLGCCSWQAASYSGESACIMKFLVCLYLENPILCEGVASTSELKAEQGKAYPTLKNIQLIRLPIYNGEKQTAHNFTKHLDGQRRPLKNQ